MQTPKRKRGEDLGPSPIKFSFDPAADADPEDGSNSPRSRVAHKFRGLALESGGGATSDDSDVDTVDLMRKRQRADEEMPQPVGVTDTEGRTVPEPEFALLHDGKASEDAGALHRAYPSINRLSDSKSRVTKKRSGSPPLRLKRTPAQTMDGFQNSDEAEIVDPVRAALTWHDDEITMYDPEDEDDDGTGINGIGFKPTPALAQARTMKRRQQMAEYRKREESDARARRSQRRRGGPTITIGPADDKSTSRRVRFMDAEAQSLAIKSGGD